MPRPTTNSGMTLHAVRRSIAPCCHHTISSSTAGNEHVTLLLSSAQPNSTAAGKKRGQTRIADSANIPESTFFRSQTHATDSTCIGCSAKSAAATQAPGTRRRTRTSHRSSALSVWRRTFVRW